MVPLGNYSLTYIGPTFLVGLVESLTLKMIFYEFSETKNNYICSRKILVNLSVIAVSIILSVLTIIDMNFVTKVIIGLIMFCCVYKLNFNVKLFKTFFICTSYYFFLACVEIFLWFIVSGFSTKEKYAFVMKDNYIKLEVIVFQIVIILLALIIVKLFKMKLRAGSKECKYLTIPTLVYLVVVLAILEIMFEMRISSTDIKLILLFISVLLTMFIYSFIIFSKIFELNELKLFNKLILEKIKMLQKHYLYLRDPIYNVALEFNTGNLVVDAILTEKNCICKFKNIKLLVKIDVSKFNFIDYDDLCSLFYNLIDNSIELCETITSKEKPRIIRITGGQKRKNIFVLKCEAPKEFEFIEKNELISCMKSNTDIDKKGSIFDNTHLDSIKKILESFDADVQVKTSCNKVYLNIIFYLNENQIFKLDKKFT